MGEILVTGSAGRSSTATMIAALLRASGAPAALTLRDGDPLVRGEDREQSASANDDVTWRIRLGPLEGQGSAELVIFTPILPATGNAGAITAQLCAGRPPTVKAVTAPQRESSLDVLRPAFPNLREVATLCQLSRGRSDGEGQEFRLRTPRNDYRLKVPVLGQFQLENAAAALLAVEQLDDDGIELTPEGARAALAEIRLPGRFEVLRQRPLTVVDAAAQPASLRRFCDGLRELAGTRHLRLVLDARAAFDPAGVLPVVSALRPDLFAILGREQTEERNVWREACYEGGFELQIAPDLAAAVDGATALSETGDAIAVTGSRAAAAVARALVLGLTPPAAGAGYTDG